MSKKSKSIDILDKLDKKFNEEEGIVNRTYFNETIIPLNVGEADFDYTRIFGANKNLLRAIARLQDGFKPVAGRIYYTWWYNTGKPQNTNPETLKKLEFRKVSRIANDTAMIHPHGTAAAEEYIGRAGQYWANNVLTIVPQGSYGNIRKDSPAAGRYIEAKMSEYLIDCFFSDFDKYGVPMKLGYDGQMYEPEYLPSKYPSVLFNPQFSSIGFGLASNICSFNISEVLDATIKLLKNPDSDILLIPDSPTGADIVDEGQFKKLNKTGVGKFSMRASAEIDYKNNTIHISSLPLNGASADVISKVINLKRNGNKEFEFIKDIHDNTKNGEVDITFILGPSKNKPASPDRVLRELYKKSVGLKDTYPVCLLLIDDYEPKVYSVKGLLLAWIDYRMDAVRSMLVNSLSMALNKQHMNDVLLQVFNDKNLDTAISIARKSKSKAEMSEAFMKEFGITSLQANTISEIKMYDFNKDSYENFKKISEDLKKEIDDIRNTLSEKDGVKEFIIKQLEEGKKKYGGPRKSKIIKDDSGIEDIPDTDHLLGISESGFIKKVSYRDGTYIGKIGNKSPGPINVLQVNNRESVIIIDSMGIVSKIPVSSVPTMDSDEDIGVDMRQLFTVSGKVRALMEIPSENILDQDDEDIFVLIITKNGIAKRMKLSEFKNLNRAKSCIKLKDNDEIMSAVFSLDQSKNKDIVIFTNKGNGLRLSANDIPTYSMSAGGVETIILEDDETVEGASIINNKKKYLLSITSMGNGKITDLSNFPTDKRRSKPLVLTKLSSRDTLIGVCGVNASDKIVLYHKTEDPNIIDIKSMSVSTRIAPPTKITKVKSGDSIIAFQFV